MNDNNEDLSTQDFKQRYLWGIYLRYAAVGLGLLLYGYSFLLGEKAGATLLLVVAITLYNLLAHYIYRSKQKYRMGEIVVLIGFFQVLDILAAAVLVGMTGGLESPYWFLYPVLMIISGFGTFSRYSYLVLFIVAFTVIFYLGLLGIAFKQLIPVFGSSLVITPQVLLKTIFNRAIFTIVVLLLFAATVYYFSKLINQNRELLSKKNRELLRTLEELKDIGRMKDDFITNVSHELRTPLAIVRENLSLIEDRVVGEINEKQRYLLAGARGNLDNLGEILNSILDSSKITSGALEIRRRKTDINLLVAKAVDLLKDKAQRKAIEIETILPEKSSVYVDPDQLTRVFVNLIDNAIKYTQKSGRITISLELSENEIRGSICDNGIGIDEQEIPLLFERFVRAKKAEEMGVKGVGLGLSICKGIIELHRGKIWVESKPNQGTKFIFVLPRVEVDG